MVIVNAKIKARHGWGRGWQRIEGESQCLCQGQGDRVRLSVRFMVKVRVNVRVE